MGGPANTRFALGVHMLTLICGHPERPLSSEEIADSAGSNPVHVRRVLGQLRTAGFVASKPGAKGGWQLLADPATTTLADVWNVVHADQPVLDLHSANPDCPVGRGVQAMLVDVDARARAALVAELATTTVADIVARAEREAQSAA